ncbi:cytochrome P450 [Roridomyces roridus]|uniref:Cytochrome P450 n=1 Tax=Roridomyces roridus TaxID=1738132 RepID=A0AAD7FKM5_9AGAR|nr:cytochrome P450 [Roridomyces roridus]
MFLLSLVAVLVAAALYLRNVGSRERGLPPGPPTFPIIGNLHILPTEFIQYKFTEWARQYGGIYSLKMGASTTIVLTSPKLVKELLENQNASTADRPASHLVETVCGRFHLSFARYGALWRTQRRAAHAILGTQAVTRLFPIQRAEAAQSLHDILASPESFYAHLERYAHSVIMSAFYGTRAPRCESPEITAFFEMIHDWSALNEPGAVPPVDLFPILKFVPGWLATWKRTAMKVRKLQRQVYFGLLDRAAERIGMGERNGSGIEDVLERQDEFRLHREMIGYLGGTLMEAGSETTSSYLKTLILCMIAYPDVQRRAQDEMDRVVGVDRIPTLAHLPHLCYIQALILETHRFRPTLPLLLPHATTATEKCGGYVVPSGSTVFVNLWGIFQDPDLYDDPEKFEPERYLLTENGAKPGVDADGLKPNLSFGVGRRSCPGIHLAENSININVMNLIWAFDFQPAMDAAGNPVQPDMFAYHKGLGTAPLPFKCRITPRSAEKADIIRREFLDAEEVFVKFESGLGEEDKEFLRKSRRQG